LLPLEEVHELIRTSSVVVSHAGVGSALTVLELGRTPIVCARSARHGEHIDDHQADLTDYLSHHPRVVVRNADEITADDLLQVAQR
jgi:UDP-N-acetylglucosamine--N-acetylmuramyl-(pentapeptide) pyrophosphoryl-undecaprenol N-acetylglucosamine transferase